MTKKTGRRIVNTIFTISILTFICIGLIKINIINTRALSPLGRTNDNYELVSEEFGEEFSKFIKDNVAVKIYTGDSQETLVKIGDSDFIIKDESELVSGTKYLFNKVGEFFWNIKNKIDTVSTEINSEEIIDENTN